MNYKIVLDAGHGGDDPGASGNGIIEKELTLEITKYLYDRFKELGIPVKITRTTDETLTPTERVNRVLNAYGDGKDVIVISSHINAGGGDGAEVIYPLRNNSTLPNLILQEIKNKGQNVREAYQRRLPSDLSKDYYFMQRNTGNTQAITVEYGFLDSTGDDVLQLKNNYKEYAEAVLKAVTSYIKKDYIPVGNGDIYTVKSGDSLYSIAKKYNTTVDQIKSLNGLSSNLLSVGQNILLPSTIIDTEEFDVYIVKSGDSLYSIAKKYNTTVDKIKELNNLNSNLLSIGQTLLIPSIELIEEVNPEFIDYIVISGDTLYDIARRNNITVDKLKSINNLTTNSLSIGQIIKIPVNNINLYTVKSGDSLYSIAKKYNTTVDKLKESNNLSSNLLSMGQQLKV